MKIEIVGPAGVGKSTLTKNLVHNSSKISKLAVPTTDKLRYFPFFTRSMVSLIPSFLSLPKQNDRKLTRRELAWLCVVNGWSRELMRSPDGVNNPLIIDQGPIFLITSLYIFGPSYLHSESAACFWQPIFLDWARVLDMIVVLDASNECLYQRIITRPKSHLQLEMKKDVVFDFLDQWRQGYTEVLNKLTTQIPSPRILKVDTEQVPIDRICRLVKMEIINHKHKHE